MMNVLKIVAISASIIALIVLYLGSVLHRRINYTDQSLRAWHVVVPWFVSVVSPEHTIALREWAGTGDARYPAPAGEHEEITASKVLLSTGIADPGSELVKGSDGHYVLRKPAQEWKEFSWHYPIRISPWSKS